MIQEDAILLRKVRQGNKAAFGEIVKRHESRIFKTVRSMLGEGPDTQDVVQKVFIRFYNAINKFKGDSKLETYLTRIAINLSLNEIRSRKKNLRRTSSLTESNETQYTDDASNPARLELRDAIQKALQSLPEEMRAVVVLRLIEGYSTKETAKILELPMGTVGSRLARAQEKLKIYLKDIL